MSKPAPIEQVEKFLRVGFVEHVGSRVTCLPPPVGTDDDWLVVSSGGRHQVERQLIEAGWERGGSRVPGGAGDDESPFASYTLDDPATFDKLNVIVTEDNDFADRFMAATSVAKRLNLLDKGDRVALFRAVLYGEECDARAIEAVPT